MILPRNLLVAAVLIFPWLNADAADWPQWRGPDRSGSVREPGLKLERLPSEPRVLWQLEVGLGQSSPVVAGGVLVYLDGVAGEETAHGVDAATGKALWKTVVGPMVEFQNAYGEGPRCTPLIDGDCVYVQSCGGEFKCLGLRDGRELWGVSFEKQFEAPWLGNKSKDPSAKETASRRHGNNGSAVVDGDKIFVPVGSPTKGTLVAFEKRTGKQVWSAGSDNTAYSSVMVGTLAGVRQAVHFTADALMGVAVSDGKVLWREPLKTGAKRHVATPVLDGDTVTVASTSLGTLRLRVSEAGGAWKVERVWENPAVKTVIGSGIQMGKNFFTLGPGARCDLVCLDAQTGEEKWKEGGLGDYASLTGINDVIVVLDSTGELRLVRASESGYEEMGRAQVVGKTWASPAYSGGRLYLKDSSKLVAVQIVP
jgi:outer membrane protein assembly factor BamB